MAQKNKQRPKPKQKQSQQAMKRGQEIKQKQNKCGGQQGREIPSTEAVLTALLSPEASQASLIRPLLTCEGNKKISLDWNAREQQMRGKF